MNAPGAYVSNRDAHATRDLPLDVQIPLQYVRTRRILSKIVCCSSAGGENGKDLIREARSWRVKYNWRSR